MLAMMFGIAARAQYRIGDIYDKAGLKGIVIRVDNTGQHGVIMSVKKCSKKWLRDSDDKFETAAFYEDDGEKNMKAIEDYLAETGKNWDIFPFFEWCRSLGDGWYAPSSDELKDILLLINGGEGRYNEKYMKVITKTLKKAKGDGLVDKGMYGTFCPYSMLSSTETDGGEIYALHFLESKSSAISRTLGGSLKAKGEFKVLPLSKSKKGKYTVAGLTKLGSRAVHKF